MATVVFGTVNGNWSDGSKWVGGSKPANGDTASFIATSGNCTIDAAQTCAVLSAPLYVGVLTHNAFVLTVNGSVTFNTAGLMTYTPLETSTITINSAGATLTTGGNLMPLITTGNTITLGDNLSFMNSKVMSLTLANTLTLNGKTISGNSAINRVLIKSSVVGTGKQITVGTGTFANADFQDITFSKATDLDLSAITGLSGDCGGNTLIGGGTNLTFTGTAQQTATGTSSFTWSTHGWTSRVPLPQDDVVINNAFSASQTITADMPRLGRSINFTGATGTPTWAFGALNDSIYGSLTLISGMTISGNGSIIFSGRTAGLTITSNTRIFTVRVTFSCPNGTYTLQDDLISSAGTSSLFYGTLNDGNHNVTVGVWSMSGSGVRSLVKGTGTWTVGGGVLAGGNTAWQVGTVGSLTFSDAGTTVISDTSAIQKIFAGGGLTYNNLSVSGRNVLITGANTFNILSDNTGGQPEGLYCQSGVTQTVSSFTTNGTAGNLAKLRSDTSGLYGGGITLNGTADAYSMTDHADFRPAGNFSVMAVFRTTKTGVNQFIFQKFLMYLSLFRSKVLLLQLNQ